MTWMIRKSTLIHDTQNPHPNNPAPYANKRRKKGKTSQFSRRQLKKGEDWKEWDDTELKMLEDMETDDMYGSPIHKSQLPKESVCLGTVWTYLIKLVSEWKNTRNC